MAAHPSKTREAQGRLAVSRDLDVITFSFKIELQALGEMLLVFDDQDPAHSLAVGRGTVS